MTIIYGKGTIRRRNPSKSDTEWVWVLGSTMGSTVWSSCSLPSIAHHPHRHLRILHRAHAGLVSPGEPGVEHGEEGGGEGSAQAGLVRGGGKGVGEDGGERC